MISLISLSLTARLDLWQLVAHMCSLHDSESITPHICLRHAPKVLMDIILYSMMIHA